MSDRLKAMLELEKRGKLPAEFAPLLAEARKRGLVPGGQAPEWDGTYSRQNAGMFQQGGASEPVNVMDPVQGNVFPGVERALDNVVGLDNGVMSPGEKIGTFLNKTGEAATLGLVGDEASAAVESIIPGVSYADRRDHYRQQEAQLEQENPGLALGAELGGALVGAMAPGGAIGTLVRGAGMLPRIGVSAATGAGMGATYGAMEGEGAQDRLNQAGTGAAWGLGVGAAAPVVGAGVQRVADNFVGNRAVRQAAANAPSTDELRRIGQAAYREVDDAGLQVTGDAFERARQGIQDNLLGGSSYSTRPGGRTITPNTAAVMDDMAEMSAEMAGAQRPGLPFREIDHVRRQAGAAAGNIANKADQQAGSMIIEGLDDFVNNLGPDDVVSGDPQVLQSAIAKARDTWSRMLKSQLIDDAIDAGENNYLSGGASGIRNQFKRILKNKRLSRGFSEAEIAMMRKVVNGSIPQTLLNYAGSGLGMMGTIGAGAGIGGLPGAIIGGAAAAGARRGSEAVARKNADVVRALVANGGLERLPVASDQSRRVIEALMRRGTAASAQ